MDWNYCFIAFWVLEIIDTVTSVINFTGYPALANDCLMALTSVFQLEVRFAQCKAPRIVLRFHLSGMADFQCTCGLPGF